MKRWEYLKLWNVNISELDKFGAIGWELVYVLNDRTNSELYVFKRELTI